MKDYVKYITHLELNFVNTKKTFNVFFANVLKNDFFYNFVKEFQINC